jgi:hypothetical protein
MVAEIGMGLTSLNAALNIVKAMIGLRDAEAFRTKAIELQGVIAQALGEVIQSREAHLEFPRFDGHTLTFRGECPDAENEEPVPCGFQGTDRCTSPLRARR